MHVLLAIILVCGIHANSPPQNQVPSSQHSRHSQLSLDQKPPFTRIAGGTPSGRKPPGSPPPKPPLKSMPQQRPPATGVGMNSELLKKLVRRQEILDEQLGQENSSGQFTPPLPPRAPRSESPFTREGLEPNVPPSDSSSHAGSTFSTTKPKSILQQQPPASVGMPIGSELMQKIMRRREIVDEQLEQKASSGRKDVSGGTVGRPPPEQGRSMLENSSGEIAPLLPPRSPRSKSPFMGIRAKQPDAAEPAPLRGDSASTFPSMGLSARFPSLDAEPLPPPPSPVGSPEGVAGAGPSSPSWPPPPEEAYGPPYKPVEVYEYLLRRQGFYCRIVHPFTTIDYMDVMYEMVLKDDEVKLYYTALTKSGEDKRRKIIATEVLSRSGLQNDFKDTHQSSTCTTTMRNLLEYAWNYNQGRFSKEEGGPVEPSEVQKELERQLIIESTTWRSFGGNNSYAISSSLGSDILVKFASNIFPEGAVELPNEPEFLWHLKMEGDDGVSMALNRDFTIHHIHLPGLPTPWDGMVDAIMGLTTIKRDYAQAIPTSSEDTALAAFGSYLESICMIGSRSKEEIVDNVETIVWPLGEKVYDQCNTYKAPLPISVMMVKSLRKVEKSTFEVPSTSNLAGVMMALDAFARRYVKN